MNACQRVYLSSVMILVTFLWNATIDGSISLLPEVAAGRPCSQFSSANIESILRLISGGDTNVFAIDTCSHPKRRGVGEQKEKKGKVKKVSWRLYHFLSTLCSSSLPFVLLLQRTIKRRGGKRRKKRSIVLLLSSFLFLTFSPRDRFLRASCWPSRWKYFR